MRARLRLLEHEFGEPVFDIVKGFAAMGFSRSDAGRAMDYNPEYFTRNVLPEIDPDGVIQWPAHCRDRVNVERYQGDDYRRRQRELNRRNARRRALKYEVNGEWLTVREIAERAGTHVDTIYDRLRRGEKGVDLIRPPMSRQARGVLGVTVRRRKFWAGRDEVGIAKALYADGMSMAEIARKMDRPYGTVVDWCVGRTRQAA